MSLNKYMHKRNPFKNKKIDFKDLSEKYAFFKEAFTNVDNIDEVTIDFKSPSHIVAISRALLLDVMHLDIHLPLDRLIPTIPLRMNYILWIEDLLTIAPINKKNNITIYDIGCGASCIYPVLGASKNNWYFKTSEIDEVNFTIAVENVVRNNLSDKIEVLKVCEEDPAILDHAFSKGGSITFIDCVMCNPPFFANTLDKTALLNTRNPEDRDSAKSINTSIRNESLTEGGEVKFAMRLVDESILYQKQIGIFTIMLGKKSSSEALKKYFMTKTITNYSIYEFCQGRVMRWGVAWSFLEHFKHPKSEFQLHKEQTRPPLLWNIPTTLAENTDYSTIGIYDALKSICKKLEIEYLEQKNRQSEGGGFHLLITAKKNTWSHQRRKRREMQKLSKALMHANDEVHEEPESKRRKIDFICSEATALDCNTSQSNSSDLSFDDCILKCTLNVVIIMENDLPKLQLQVRYLDGDRESMNQVLTFIKNSLLKTSS